MKKWLDFIFGPSLHDLYVFFLQLQTYYTAGIAPLTAMTALVEQTENKLLKEELKKMTRELNNGERLATAFEKHGQYFPRVCPQVIAAGEVSSSLGECLEEMASHIEQVGDIMKKITSAVLPVAISVSVMIGTVLVLMLYVTPYLLKMFQEANLEIPKITMYMVYMFNFILHYWYILLAIGAAGVAFAYQYYRKHPEIVDWILLHVPFYRHIHYNFLQYKFVRIFVLLKKAGIASKEAIEITSQTIENARLSDMLRKTALTMRDGIPLAQALVRNNKDHILDGMIINLIKTSESLGRMESVLEKAAVTYQKRIRKQTDDLNYKIVPFVVFPAYLVLIGIVLSVMYPILMLSQGV